MRLGIKKEWSDGMAKAVITRQFGDEYQQLVFWKYALDMLSGNHEISNILYEDKEVKYHMMMLS